MLSKVWAHVGTFLSLFVSGLSYGNVVSLTQDERIVLTVVTGLLVAVHIPFASKVESKLPAFFSDVVHAYDKVTETKPVSKSGTVSATVSNTQGTTVIQ